MSFLSAQSKSIRNLLIEAMLLARAKEFLDMSVEDLLPWFDRRKLSKEIKEEMWQSLLFIIICQPHILEKPFLYLIKSIKGDIESFQELARELQTQFCKDGVYLSS
ncbi:MAG: hypothetical protein EZS28_053609, partial [Streblomastix strix]